MFFYNGPYRGISLHGYDGAILKGWECTPWAKSDIYDCLVIFIIIIVVVVVIVVVAISLSVCLSAPISKNTHVQILPTSLSMLHVAVARPWYDGNAYVMYFRFRG